MISAVVIKGYLAAVVFFFIPPTFFASSQLIAQSLLAGSALLFAGVCWYRGRNFWRDQEGSLTQQSSEQRSRWYAAALLLSGVVAANIAFLVFPEWYFPFAVEVGAGLLVLIVVLMQGSEARQDQQLGR